MAAIAGLFSNLASNPYFGPLNTWFMCTWLCFDNCSYWTCINRRYKYMCTIVYTLRWLLLVDSVQVWRQILILACKPIMSHSVVQFFMIKYIYSVLVVDTNTLVLLFIPYNNCKCLHMLTFCVKLSCFSTESTLKCIGVSKLAYILIIAHLEHVSIVDTNTCVILFLPSDGCFWWTLFKFGVKSLFWHVNQLCHMQLCNFLWFHILNLY